MTVSPTKIITIGTLSQFKTKQDAFNASTFIKRDNVSIDSTNNELKIVKVEAATGVDAVILKALTASSNLDATKLTGTIPMGCMPAGALERVVVVADDTARFALTTSQVQLGDVVKVTETSKMYFVKDESHLDTEAGYEVFVAGAAASVDWANVQNKPSFGTSAGDFAEGNHTHGNISNDGKVGSTADLPLITGTAGVVQAGGWATGVNSTSATAFVNGADSRLSDSRDPNDHASNKVTLMTGYSKGSAAASIAATDSLNTAIGKLEYKLDTNIANDGSMASYAKSQTNRAIATTDSIVEGLGVAEKKIDDEVANTGLMSNYAIASSAAAISTSDSVVVGLGKAEKKVDDAIANAGSMASYAQGSGNVSTSDSIVVGLGKVEAKADAAISNAGDMGDYAKASSISNVATTDSIVEAIAKVEAKADNFATNAEIDSEIFGETGE